MKQICISQIFFVPCTQICKMGKLGLLLCTEGSEEQINLLQLDKSGIRVAQYLTELPSKEVLLRQLHKSLAAAKELSTER